MSEWLQFRQGGIDQINGGMMTQLTISRRWLSIGSLAVAAATATGAGSRAKATAGRFKTITNDVTDAADHALQPGAGFDIAAPATLKLMGDFTAPATRVFTGGGRVDLNHGRALYARPEWWGAVADDPRVDCGPAFAACLAAHPAMQLGPGDYYLARTWTIDRANARVWGIGRTKGARGTRLVLAGGDDHVMRVGTETVPAAINDYLRGIDMRWIELARTEAPRSPAGDDTEAPAGLRIRHVLDCVFEGLRANEHAIGFSVRGAVRTYLRDCAAFRSVSSAMPSQDVFIGFDLDGRHPPIPTGGNASLYLVDCLAGIGGQPPLATSIGCRLRGAISDSFIVRLETTSIGTGILVDGAGEGARGTQIDVDIDRPVLDACDAGIVIADLGADALIDIRAPYIALAASGRTALSIDRCAGGIELAGGQLVGWVAPTVSAARGLHVRNSAGVSGSGLRINGFPRPVELDHVDGFDLTFAVRSPDGPSLQPAVRLSNCRRGYLRPRIDSGTGGYPVAVAIDAPSRSIMLERSQIDGAAAVTLDGVTTARSRFE